MRLVVAAALVAVLVSPDAEACSPDPSYGGRQALPYDGSTGVATNAIIHIRYWFRGDPTEGELAVITDVKVRPRGGEPIAADITWDANMVRVRAEFAPGTTYEVLDRVESDCAFYFLEDCTLPADEVFLTFTTGEAPDLSPPAFAGVTSIGQERESCDSSACCGPYDVFMWPFEWDPPTDASPTFMNVYQVTPTGEERVAAYVGTFTAGMMCGGEWAAPEIDELSGPGLQYVVRAIDLAGNEEQNSAIVTIPAVSCDDVPDGGMSAASDGGCAVGRGGRGNATQLGLLTLALAIFARWRR